MSWDDNMAPAPQWFPWVLGAHWTLVVVGLLTQTWLLVSFCLWTETGMLQTPGLIIWLTLTLSPLLGLMAIKSPRLRPAYAAFAAATPLFFVLVFALNALNIATCDAP